MELIKNKIVSICIAVLAVITLSLGISFAFGDFFDLEETSSATTYTYTIQLRLKTDGVENENLLHKCTIEIMYENSNIGGMLYSSTNYELAGTNIIKHTDWERISYIRKVFTTETKYEKIYIHVKVVSANGYQCLTGTANEHTFVHDYKQSSGTSYMIIEEVKFAQKIKINFDKINGSGGTSTITTTKDSTMPNISVPTRNGYEFMGYYSGKDGTGTKYYNADGTGATICDLEDGSTLYAYWKDIEKPVIERSTYVTREDGYDSYAYATDNVGVKNVRFPTWTSANSQDDIIWGDGIKGTYTIDGQTYNYKYSVYRKDHNNELGSYNTHIYAYDEEGNQSNTGGNGNIYFARNWTDFASTNYAGGNGTQSDPYQIATAQQLALLAQQSKTDSLEGKYFKQTASIDLENKATKDSKYVWYVWDGIASLELPFKGNYDGSLQIIHNLNYQNVYDTYTGFFVCVENSQLKNIILNKSIIVGNVHVGGIVAKMTSSSITNCIINSSVIQSRNKAGWSVGGIVKGIDGKDSQVSNCIVKKSEIVGYNVGGICVLGGGAKLTDCSAIDCQVKGTNAGMVGYVYDAGENVSSYGYGKINENESKVMYGDSASWSNWSYIEKVNPNDIIVNEGYPIQSGLFWIGGISGSQNVYNYLKNTLGFSEG